MASQPSPSILNYYIGKGVISWQPVGGGSYRDLGNCPRFEFDPKVTRLAHYSARLGTKFKDDERITVKEPEVTLLLDEWTQDNLALALIGSMVGSTVNIFDQADVRGSLKFVGSNDVGPKKIIILPTVVLTPNGRLNLIEDGYGQIELSGPVLGDPGTGSFGTIEDA